MNKSEVEYTFQAKVAPSILIDVRKDVEFFSNEKRETLQFAKDSYTNLVDDIVADTHHRLIDIVSKSIDMERNTSYDKKFLINVSISLKEVE